MALVACADMTEDTGLAAGISGSIEPLLEVLSLALNYQICQPQHWHN